MTTEKERPEIGKWYENLSNTSTREKWVVDSSMEILYLHDSSKLLIQ